MDAIKIADTENGWAEIGGNILEFTEDLHSQSWNCRRRPS
jgi:hypothetical protein